MKSRVRLAYADCQECDWKSEIIRNGDTRAQAWKHNKSYGHEVHVQLWIVYPKRAPHIQIGEPE